MTFNNMTAGPTKLQTWGYGFLFVTIINIGAVFGICIVPMMNKRLYKKVIMFLICLAVGTLAANAVLCLIPEAHGIQVDTEEEMFVWKNMTVLGGIYLFFLVERILKIIAIKKKEKRQMAGPEKVCTVYDTKSPSYQFTPQALDDHSNAPCNGTDIQRHKVLPSEEKHAMLNGDAKGDRVQINGDHCNYNHSDMDFITTKNAIASVAYMIVFGDGLHNFIDGLAIGASFTHSIVSGISISLAVICEEFPHELGDFAILLKSGLSVRQAVMANLASAVTCYIGLIIGIVLGELTSAGEWIFALAAGMFLYISLVNMLPEINNSSDPSLSPTNIQIFLLQNAGLLLGFALILILTLYESAIDLTT